MLIKGQCMLGQSVTVTLVVKAGGGKVRLVDLLDDAAVRAAGCLPEVVAERLLVQRLGLLRSSIVISEVVSTGACAADTRRVPVAW